MKNKPLYDKLTSRIAVSKDCWIWQGAAASGYGRMWWQGKIDNTNRLMWKAFHGDIPDGLFVCHTCDVKLCLNPVHLFLATPKDNMDDMTRKGRRSCGASHSAALRKAWDSDLRKSQSKILRTYNIKAHGEKAEAAGVPSYWKYCPGCKTWYPRSRFNKNRARYDGIAPYCKECKKGQTNKRRRRIASKRFLTS